MHHNLQVNPPQRSSSIRLRKKRDEAKQKSVKNRRSGEFGYKLNSDIREITDDAGTVLTNTKAGTLDPGPATGSIQHNLRPLLRNKYNTRQPGFKDTSSQEKDARYSLFIYTYLQTLLSLLILVFDSTFSFNFP